MSDEMTRLELQLLREINGDLPASAWGAWVGACAGALRGMGLIDRQWKITDAGRAALQKEAVSCENGVNSETPDPINVQYQDARRPY